MADFVDLATLRRFDHERRPPDAPTEEFCPCTKCHDTPRRLIVLEVAYGCCVTCLNRHGQVRTIHEADQVAAARERLRAAGIPAGYLSMTWSTWEGPVPGGLDHLGRDAWCVYAHGPSGSGKTHLGVAILSERIGRGDGGKFWLCSELLAQLKESFDTGSHLLSNEVSRARLLMLDDVFAERETPWARTTIGDLLRHRHAEALATIITSNLSPSQVAESDARLASRLADGVIVRRSSGDFRLARHAGRGETQGDLAFGPAAADSAAALRH
jgi:hypothetical protein